MRKSFILLTLLLLTTVMFVHAGDFPTSRPDPNDTITNPAVTFAFTGDDAVTSYKLKVQSAGKTFVYKQKFAPDDHCNKAQNCSFTVDAGDWKPPNNTTLAWRIIGKTAEGKLRTDKQRFTTNFPLPAKPSLNNPSSGDTVSKARTTFTWNTAAHTNSYKLIVKFNGSRLPADAPDCNNTCSVTLTLPATGTYTWLVKAKNAYGVTKSDKLSFSYNPAVATAEPTSTPTPNPDAAATLLDLVNEARCDAGLVPLVYNADLNEAAQRHNNDMLENNFFSHTGSDGSSPSKRVSDTGYSGSKVAENIAGGYASAQNVFNGWMASPGHRANILGKGSREMGIAFGSDNDSSYYWTQVFAARNSTALATCG